ncbi:hypothetical protein M8C21_028778, partial [Ambrosia artemisiifolia]
RLATQPPPSISPTPSSVSASTTSYHQRFTHDLGLRVYNQDTATSNLILFKARKYKDLSGESWSMIVIIGKKMDRKELENVT